MTKREVIDIETAFANYMKAKEFEKKKEDEWDKATDKVRQRIMEMPVCKNKLVRYKNDLYLVNSSCVNVEFVKVEE